MLIRKEMEHEDQIDNLKIFYERKEIQNRRYIDRPSNYDISKI